MRKKERKEVREREKENERFGGTREVGCETCGCDAMRSGAVSCAVGEVAMTTTTNGPAAENAMRASRGEYPSETRLEENGRDSITTAASTVLRVKTRFPSFEQAWRGVRTKDTEADKDAGNGSRRSRRSSSGMRRVT